MSFDSRLIVIAYPDADYIKGFEEELMKHLDADVEIRVITETDYLMQFFSVRRTIDALIIAQELIGNYLQEHDIRNLMILESRQVSVYDSDDSKVLHYVGQDDIIKFVDRCFSDFDEPDEYFDDFDDEETGTSVKVAAVYSPIGGCGKSLTALALAKKLKMLEEKVLVIGCDSLQSFGVLLDTREYADEALAGLLQDPVEETYWTVLKNINQDNVPCLLPFEKPLVSLGIGGDEFINLINILKEKKDFTYIILDIGSSFNNETLKLFNIADICIFITEPNVDAARKLEKFRMNQDLIPDTDSVTLVNQYHSDGLQLSPENLFGAFRAYSSAAEAMDDPVFYRLALRVTGEAEQ